VPLMAGWNKDEGFNFTLHQGDDAKRPYVDLARAIFGERTDKLLQHYPDGSPDIAASSARALGGDLVIIHPTWAWIEAQKQSGRADIFRFRFDRAPLTPQGWFGERDSRDAGAFHAGELLYVFDNLHAFPWLLEDADRALAKLASSYWVNFVATGDPNGPDLPPWPSHRSKGGPVMALDTPHKAGPEEWRERHLFLKSAREAARKVGQK
jgi:para-nitrobenzyl esterase